MKVLMLNTESGRHTGFDTGQFHCLVGHEYQVPDDLGKSWVKQGIAKKIREQKPKEPTKEVKKNGN